MALLLPGLLFAQVRTELRGRVIGSVTGSPLEGVIVSMDNGDRQVHTDREGVFQFRQVPAGEVVHVVVLDAVVLHAAFTQCPSPTDADAGVVDV